MERLCSAKQMKALDQEAMHGAYAIAPAVLMENAGSAVVHKAESYISGWFQKKVIIFCGNGNNGGDGFVIARHLLNEGATVCIYLINVKANKYSDEAKAHLETVNQLAQKGECEIIDFKSMESEEILLEHKLYSCDIVIDSLIGTGFHGNLRDSMANIVETINYFHRTNGFFTISVDVPSGVNSDTGAVSKSDLSGYDNAIEADLTVTFGHLKRGFCFYPGKAFCGSIEIDSIGMPYPLLVRMDSDSVYLLDSYDMEELLPARSPDSHKGIHGTVAIVTGSNDMAGAALMAAHGALRSGAGKLFLRVPAKTAPYCIGKMPEMMVKGIGKSANFTAKDAEEILEEASSWDVIAMGPGMGKNAATKQFIKKVIQQTTCPIILDADALNLMAGESKFIKKYGDRLIMTPHLGEFSRLSGLSVSAIKEDIITAAKNFAKEWGVTLVLKGAPTVVVDPQSMSAFVNPTGNPGMATGGMGDILTGMIAAFVCHEGIHFLYQAACAGAYVHGAAGDNVSTTYGPYGYSPMELADYIPRIISDIENEVED